MKPVVLIESPYRGVGTEAIRYLACCLLDSVLRGECPIASHAIYPLCLLEDVEYAGGKTGREIGLECRDSLVQLREHEYSHELDEPVYPPIRVAAYVDTQDTPGMRRTGCYLPDRRLQGVALEIWQSGKWPTSARWASTNEGVS
jgi:hypothetical protein